MSASVKWAKAGTSVIAMIRPFFCVYVWALPALFTEKKAPGSAAGRWPSRGVLPPDQ